MNLSEIIGKSFDVIAKRPVILVLCLIPAILRIVVNFAGLYWFWWSDYWTEFAEIPWDYMAPEEIMETVWDVIFEIAAVTVVVVVIDIVIWITAMVAFSMVIAMTAASLEGKEMTLSEAFRSISGKLFLIIIASAAVWIIVRVGICALCIGAFILWVLLALVKQGIIIDNLGFGESLSKSFNIARPNFFDIMLILLLFFVIKAGLGLTVFFLPFVGDALGYLVDAFSVAALTILYIDRRG